MQVEIERDASIGEIKEWLLQWSNSEMKILKDLNSCKIVKT
jgi:hypothetical protein